MADNVAHVYLEGDQYASVTCILPNDWNLRFGITGDGTLTLYDEMGGVMSRTQPYHADMKEDSDG